MGIGPYRWVFLQSEGGDISPPCKFLVSFIIILIENIAKKRAVNDRPYGCEWTAYGKQGHRRDRKVSRSVSW